MPARSPVPRGKIVEIRKVSQALDNSKPFARRPARLVTSDVWFS